jgi:hypothetical protein
LTRTEARIALAKSLRPTKPRSLPRDAAGRFVPRKRATWWQRVLRAARRVWARIVSWLGWVFEGTEKDDGGWL